MTDEYYDHYVKKLLPIKEQEGLAKHVLVKLFSKPEKQKESEMQHFTATAKPNIVQQADLLFMPADRGYKYLLVVVDLYDRKTDAEPIKHKNAQDIINGFKAIYKRKILDMPQMFIQTDAGSEFKGIVEQYFENNNVIHTHVRRRNANGY